MSVKKKKNVALNCLYDDVKMAIDSCQAYLAYEELYNLHNQ